MEMETITIKEWHEKGKKLFGDNIDDWKFVCPACNMVSSIGDFKKLGVDANNAYVNCIGRHHEKGISFLNSPENKDYKYGCDWAAYGLFGTLGKGINVEMEDGKKIEAFKFFEDVEGDNDE